MRKAFNTTLSIKTIEKLHKIKEETGIPISQIIERSVNKVYGES